MNFLAHAYLAAPATLARRDSGLIAGGVLGDWIKGPLDRQALPPALLRGVALHRAIDSFADRNEAFLRSRARVSVLRRRWSGVLVDMYYDHLLAADWTAWHEQPLATFTQDTYAALAHYQADFVRAQTHPTLVAAMALMASEDWLSTYAGLDELAAILARMGLRARQPNPLADAASELIANRADFVNDFAAFLPAARTFATEWITSRSDLA